MNTLDETNSSRDADRKDENQHGKDSGHPKILAGSSSIPSPAIHLFQSLANQPNSESGLGGIKLDAQNSKKHYLKHDISTRANDIVENQTSASPAFVSPRHSPELNERLSKTEIGGDNIVDPTKDLEREAIPLTVDSDTDTNIVGDREDSPLEEIETSAALGAVVPGTHSSQLSIDEEGSLMTIESALRKCKDAIDLLSQIPKEMKMQLDLPIDKLQETLQGFPLSVSKHLLSTSGRDVMENRNPPQIQFRVRLLETGMADKIWYQSRPFVGSILDRIDDSMDDDAKAIFTVYLDVDGKVATGKKLPPSETEPTNEPKSDIVIGEHIIPSVQRRPTISIGSKNLLEQLTTLVQYYPSQIGGLTVVGHPYKVLMHNFIGLAAVRALCDEPEKMPPLSQYRTTPSTELKKGFHALADSPSPTSKFEAMTPEEQIEELLRTAKLEVEKPLGTDLSPRDRTCTELEPESEPESLADDTVRKKCDHRTAYHIGVLLGYLAPLYHREIVPELENYRVFQTATFKKLWILFEPGIEVYAMVDGQYASFVVLSCELKAAEKGVSVEQCVIKAWNLGYAGNKLYRNAKEVAIHSFDGRRKITSLEIFPVRFLEETHLPNGPEKDMGCEEKVCINRGKCIGSTQEHLQERGNFYCEIMRGGPKHMVYHGHTLEAGSKLYSGDIMVDSKAYSENAGRVDSREDADKPSGSRSAYRMILDEYLRFLPKWERYTVQVEPPDLGGGSRWAGYNDIDIQNPEITLTNHQKRLLPQYTSGYALRTKEWKIFDIEKMNHMEEYNNPLGKVRFDSGNVFRRESMLAIVLDNQQNRPDFVQGKGVARVILLHGPPGTGKTYVVESIAKETKRPMLSLTVADLGIKEELLERRLLSMFRLAETWKAIMLLDEADVFLEDRKHGELQRNCLVSVFLRTMEYYSGIIFLTTNRGGKIDDAFASRILYTAPFDLLEKEGRTQLWTDFFDMYKEQKPSVEFSIRAREYTQSNDVKKMRLNGREIRNAIQLAIILFRREKTQGKDKEDPPSKVSEENIYVALQQREKSREYYYNLWSDDKSGRAHARGNRRDRSESP